jgi:RNA polymerase sigma-70 factor (ECF subfamily)
LLREVLPVLRAMVRRACRDAQDVDDIVQDVLLSLHAVRHTYDPARPFVPWLVTIARRRAADAMRCAATIKVRSQRQSG